MKITRNQLIVVLLLIFNATFVFNTMYVQHLYNFKDTVHEQISGFATSQASLCIDNGVPRLNLLHPNGNAIANLTYNISVNITSPIGIANFTINFTLVNGSFSQTLGQDFFLGDYYFNASLVTTSFADGNCNYRVFISGTNNETLCQPFDDIYTPYFTIDNVRVEPTWNNFRNSHTTNFTTFSKLSNLTNVSVGNSNAAIRFDSGRNFDAINLDGSIKTGYASLNLSLVSACFVSIIANATFFSVILANPQAYKDGSPCISCLLTNTGTNYSIAITSNGNYSIVGAQLNQSSNLTLWDDTDFERENLTKGVHTPVMFFANFISNVTGTALNDSGTYCQVSFNTTTEFNAPLNMSYNSSGSWYYFARNFTQKGNINWNVFCDGGAALYGVQNKTSNVTISNTPPELIQNISSLQWNENTILTGLDLDDYFDDIDNDNLTYSHSALSSIVIVIASNGIVSFIPNDGFFGLERVIFYANDSINTTPSNNVTLIIVEVPDSSETPSSSSSSSGGGGGGGASSKLICQEEWYCDKWSVCEDGIRTRSCWDLKICNTFKDEPLAKEECVYLATCYDGLMNNDESGLDCGGSCPPCFTCFDRQLNQDETDIDCGGMLCKKCINDMQCVRDSDCESNYCNPNGVCANPSCNDGFQNHDEEGIDCGGSCARKCPQIERTGSFGNMLNPGILLVILALLLLTLSYNLYGEKINRNLKILYYRYTNQSVPIVQKITSVELTQRINHWHGIATSLNAQRVFEEYSSVFHAFLSGNLGLPKHFSMIELETKLRKSKVSAPLAKATTTYYSKLQQYKHIKLGEDDVKTILAYGRKLVYHLSRALV